MQEPENSSLMNALLEEVKIFKEGKADVVPSSPSKKVPGQPATTPRDEKLVQATDICNGLLGMGFKYGTVVALLKYCEVADVQAGVDLLLKSPQGWPHAYVPNGENTAFIEMANAI